MPEKSKNERPVYSAIKRFDKALKEAEKERRKIAADNANSRRKYILGTLVRDEDIHTKGMHERKIQANEHIVPIDDSPPPPEKRKRRKKKQHEKSLTEGQKALAEAIDELERIRREGEEDAILQKTRAANEHILTPDGEPTEED